MAKVLNYGLELSKFELQSHYYVHFWTDTLRKGMNSVITPAVDYIVPPLFFYMDSFSIQ